MLSQSFRNMLLDANRCKQFFTNVPQDETIAICADTLYSIPDYQPCIPKEVFVELLHSATGTVEFSFNNTIYRQKMEWQWVHHLALF